MRKLTNVENYNLLRLIGLAITPSEVLFCRDIRHADSITSNENVLYVLYQEAYDHLTNTCDWDVGVDFLKMAQFIVGMLR